MYGTLADMLEDAFDEYYLELNRKINENEKKRKEIKALELEAVGGELDPDSEAYTEIEGKFDRLIGYFFKEKDLATCVDKYYKIYEQFLNCLNAFCDEIGIDMTITRKPRKPIADLIEEDNLKNNLDEEVKEKKEMFGEITEKIEKFIEKIHLFKKTFGEDSDDDEDFDDDFDDEFDDDDDEDDD
jgi:hypothetical protein